MSKKTKPVKEKKPGNPVLKGFGIPLLYFALTTVFGVILNLLNMLRIFLLFLVSDLFRIPTQYDPWTGQAIGSNELTLEIVFERFFDNLQNAFEYPEEILISGIVDNIGAAPLFTVVSMLLALIVILCIFSKKGTDLSALLRADYSPKKAVISAVMLGLGIGSVLTAVQIAGSFGYSLINDIVTESQGMSLKMLLAQPLYEIFRSNNSQSYSDIPGFLRVAKTLLDSWTQGYLENAQTLTASTVSMLTGAVTLSFVFGTGTAGNFKKKMPTFVAALLTAVLFALFGGSSFGLIGALIFGLLLGLVYAKSESLICTILFMATSGIPAILQYFVRAPFGYISRISQQLTLNVFVFHRDAEGVYNIVSLIFGALIGIVGLVLLIVGFILLLGVGKKKDQPEQKQEEESDSMVYVNDDPFANI
jgi:hypothetical protein